MVADVIQEMVSDCMLSRSRVISRVLTNAYDDALRPYGISSPQFVLLTAICKLGSASKAEIARFTQQDRSTLSRNIKLLLDSELVVEGEVDASGRAKPIKVTAAGLELMHELVPAWRAGQEQALKLLGETGASAVMAVGDEIFGMAPK
ncbi:MarR family winged helix-turn-helix transcriptional regulator [Sphingomonas glacialis]|uniref:MarR family transcriptional regulator n=1 Tax=Sphingomonas glacialis TaxID=658225 RepID=A0A502FRI7_9SPHN|nr:MarR family winged helix-turn-helix transcriptional regulator [Sphingomonas glacialis]TPG52075.1 MarR family transcriptional regulator [Sphingomonas glacialis]